MGAISVDRILDFGPIGMWWEVPRVGGFFGGGSGRNVTSPHVARGRGVALPPSHRGVTTRTLWVARRSIQPAWI
jgi:hypothetical protein